jgi:hypothetical protein
MGFEDSLADRQAESRAIGVPSDTVESVKNVGKFIRRNTRPRVGDVDQDISFVLLQFN